MQSCPICEDTGLPTPTGYLIFFSNDGSMMLHQKDDDHPCCYVNDGSLDQENPIFPFVRLVIHDYFECSVDQWLDADTYVYYHLFRPGAGQQFACAYNNQAIPEEFPNPGQRYCVATAVIA